MARTQATQDLVNAARAILEPIHPASIRAICYQLFNRGLIPSMAKQHTSRVSRHLNGSAPEWQSPSEPDRRHLQR